MQLKIFFKKAVRYLQNVNFFESSFLHGNEEDVYYQHLSTRTFVVFFALFFAILLVYNGTSTQVQTMNIPNPTLQQYRQLDASTSQTLRCPCSDISISHNVFLNITYILHHICDSIFVTSEWISYIGTVHGVMWMADVRIGGPFLFQGIQTLCQLARVTIDNSLNDLYTSKFISALVVSEQNFRLQLNHLTETFIKFTTNSFSQALHSIRDVTQTNGILSRQLTNYHLSLSGDSLYVESQPNLYDDDCSCDINGRCSTLFSIFGNSSQSSRWFIPGLYRGCYILEGLLRSRLECLYNQSCLHELCTRLENHLWMDISPLTQSNLNRFNPNTTFGEVIDELMVDVWNWTATYDGYYEACRPKECIYTIVREINIVTIVSIMIGLMGGLITALKFIIPQLFEVIRWKCSKALRTTGKA